MFKSKNFIIEIIFSILAIFLSTGSLTAQSGTVKYVYTLDYAVGKKAAYLEWVKTVVSTLQTPKEVISIVSYENYLNVSPQRVIEYEFANAIDAANYFANPDIRKVVEEAANRGINRKIEVRQTRGDYTAEKIKRGKIKYVFSLDYTPGGKAEYVNWVKSIADKIQAPKELLRVTSYDSYFSVSPTRVIEFEFESMEDAVKYFEMPEIKNIVETSVDMSLNYKISILRLRSDYNKN